MRGLDAFKLLARLAPYQLFRFAMDWNEQNESLAFAARDWERREPNSLQGVLNAYAYAISLIQNKRIITLSDIQRIHRACSEGLAHSDNIPGQFRQHFITFGITRKTASADGLIMLIALDKHSHCLRLCYESTTFSDEVPLCVLNDILGVYPGNIIFAPFDTEGASVQYSDKVAEEVESTLADFQIEMGVSDSEEKKLVVIAKTVQRLEHIHPFYDCNCRTFCMVLLNTWLMQYGFNPTLIDDPNKFDGHTVEELIELIHQGMQRTVNLCEFVRKDFKKPKCYDGISRIDIENWQEVHPTQRDLLLSYATCLTEVIHQLPNQSLRFFKETSVDNSVISSVTPKII